MDISRLRKLAGLNEGKKSKDGLEGPTKMASGRIVYFDTKEGKYYDKKTDMYLSDDEASELAKDKMTDAVNMDESLNEANNFFQPIEDKEFKNELNDRMGTTVEHEAKVKLPKDVLDQVNKRRAELEDSIKRYDNKGYNDLSTKQQALDCLNKIMFDLETDDVEGLKKAQIYFGTLMGPFKDIMPPKLIKFIVSGKIVKESYHGFSATFKRVFGNAKLEFDADCGYDEANEYYFREVSRDDIRGQYAESTMLELRKLGKVYAKEYGDKYKNTPYTMNGQEWLSDGKDEAEAYIWGWNWAIEELAADEDFEPEKDSKERYYDSD